MVVMPSRLRCVDHRRRGEAAIGAAQAGRHVVALLREPLDMGFIDDGVFPGNAGPQFAPAPVEGFIDHDGFGHAARIVAPVERKIFAGAAGAITEMRIAPYQPPGEPPRIGVEQKLVRVEAVTLLRRIGAVNAIAVKLARRDIVQIAVPDVFGALGQFDALDLAPALAVKQTEFDLLRIGGKQREIGPASVPASTEARGRSGR